MSKKILKLSYENNRDFSVAGIVSGYKDFKVCFELNHALDLNLKRFDDVSLAAGRPGSSTLHSYFAFSGKDGEDYHVISNKDKASTGFCIPELKEIDYFVVVSGAGSTFPFEQFVNRIRKIEIISGAYVIDHTSLKSVDSFLLFLES
jgi:hypothetical protein